MARLVDLEQLKSEWLSRGKQGFTLCPGVILTPSAEDFAREKGIVHSPAGSKAKSSDDFGRMTVTPVPVRSGRAVFVDDATGQELSEKPEEMTHIRGNRLVPKTHPEIAFRGKLDTLQAEILRVQLAAFAEHRPGLDRDIAELLSFTRAILAAEVKDEPLAPIRLLGLDSAGIRRASQHPQEELGIGHPIPEASMGAVCVELNFLRTQVREAELAAVNAFTVNGKITRPDIIEALNRLSGAVYIIFCRKIAGYYS